MGKTPENLQEPTSAEQQAAYTNLLYLRVEDTPTKEIAVLTHPSYAPANNDDTVVLESFIHIVPNQAGPDHGSARCRIVRHLGEPSRVDLDSLGRREPRICSVTTAFDLKRGGSEVSRCVSHQMEVEITYGEWSFCSVNHFELIG